ncbi:MAG TPA: M23 family metallopeptidase [Gemmatimonadaceae bacterium]
MSGSEVTRTARLVLLAVLFSGIGCVTSGGLRTGAEPRIVPITFPLAADSVRFTSGFGDPRDGGKRQHKGQDMFCPRWTPILAAMSGTVDWVSSERPKKEKGYELLLRGDDGNLYFYAHLNNDDPGTRDNEAPPRYAYARGLKNGDRVAAGDVVGYVGDSGDAEAAGPHLHFEIHIGKWGNAIDPAPSLRAALERRGR